MQNKYKTLPGKCLLSVGARWHFTLAQNRLVPWAVRVRPLRGKTKQRAIPSSSFCIQLSALGSSKNQEVLAIKCYSNNWSHWMLPMKIHEDWFGHTPFPSPTETSKDCINSWCPKHPVWTGALFAETSPPCLANSLNSEACEKERWRLWHRCRWSKRRVKWALLFTFPVLYCIFF